MCAAEPGTTNSSTRPPNACGREVSSTATRCRRRGALEREAVEVATDRQMAAAIDALGDDFDELIEIMTPWGATIREVRGYLPGGPHELAKMAADPT